ncbi:hypothetical protein BH23ACT5_BH23ACT5_09970 [soil metagenome]
MDSDLRPLADVLDAIERKPGDILADRLRHYRSQRGWSQRDLCQAVGDKFGATINPATVARLETGQRRVTVDEACMLAVALGVPLALLLWPIHETEPVNIAPGVSVTPWDAFEWMVGNRGFGVDDQDMKPWMRFREPIRLYRTILYERDMALRLRARLFGQDEPEDFDRLMADYMKRLRRLADYLEWMENGGYPAEGDGWTLVPADLMQDLKRLDSQLDEGRFHIGEDREEV